MATPDGPAPGPPRRVPRVLRCGVQFAEKGKQFELDFKAKQHGLPTSKYAFLSSMNCYNQYYEWKVSFEWKVQQLLAMHRQQQAPQRQEVPLSQQMQKAAEIKELKRKLGTAVPPRGPSRRVPRTPA